MILNLDKLWGEPPVLGLEKYKLQLVKHFLLDPVEDEFGSIQITSGYRSAMKQAMMDPKRAAKGVSQHQLAEAVDFITLGKPYEEVYRWMHKNLQWWQLIIYYSRGAANEIHASIPSERPEITKKALVNVDGVWLIYDGTLPPRGATA